MIKLIAVLLFVLVAAKAEEFNDFTAENNEDWDYSVASVDDIAFDTVAEEELAHISDWVDQSQAELIEVAREENGIDDTEYLSAIESEVFDSEATIEQEASEQAGDDDDDGEDDDNDDEDGTSDGQEVAESPKGRRERKPGQLGMNENRSRYRGRKYYKPRKSRSRGSSRRSRYSTARPAQPTGEPVEDEDRAMESEEVSPNDRSRFERRHRPRSRSRSRSSRSRSDSDRPRHDRLNRPDRPCNGEGCTAPPRKSNCTGRPSGHPTGMPHHKKWSTPEGRQSPHHRRSTNQPESATPDAEGTPASWWSWWSF